MKSYSNFKDLANAIISDPDIKNMVLSNNKLNIDINLKKYAKELKQMIDKNLRQYYSSYSPKMYKRHSRGQNIMSSLYVNPNSVDDSSILLEFDSNAYHINAVKSDPHFSFVPALINFGWRVHDTDVVRNNRFNYYEGSFYITNAIDEFNAMYAPYGVYAEISYDI